MQQFPSIARVKFVKEGWKDFSISANFKETQFTLPLDGTVLGPTWKKIGEVNSNDDYPVGWITWANIFRSYKTLACALDIWVINDAPAAMKNFQVLCLGMDSASSLTSLAEDWLVDPRCKRVTVDTNSAGNMTINNPVMSVLFRPQDIWGSNQDWSAIQSPVFGTPSRWMVACLATLRTTPDINGNLPSISIRLRVRARLYVEFFDRKSEIYEAIPPSPGGPVQEEVQADRKLEVS